MRCSCFPLSSDRPRPCRPCTGVERFPAPDQAHLVREFVATLLPDRPRLDEVLLAVGELVANALRHSASGQGGSFTVDVRHAAGCTAISVADEGGPAEPVVTDAAELAESGRGLRTISLIADSWGWHGDEAGRTVTVIFAAETPDAVTVGGSTSANRWEAPPHPDGSVDEAARAQADGLVPSLACLRQWAQRNPLPDDEPGGIDDLVDEHQHLTERRAEAARRLLQD